MALFEHEKQNTTQEVQNMLGRLEGRVEKGNTPKTDAEAAIKTVVEGTLEAKKIINSFDFKDKDIKEIAAFSNAWSAWEATGVFKDEQHAELRAKLQKLLDRSEEGIPSRVKRFARQVWRTEMVNFMIEKLGKTSRADKGKVMEAVMGAQKVDTTEDDPIEVLRDAAHLDPEHLKDAATRRAIAENMESSKEVWLFSEVQNDEHFSGKSLSIKVVVGGEFIKVPNELATELKFKKLYIDEATGRAYGQMENGCRGNLVIIDPPPVVPPPIDPPPIDPPPPIKPPEPKPREFSDTLGEHMAGTTRSPAGRMLTVEQAQYDDRMTPDFASKILLENFRSDAMEGLLSGLEQIPEKLRPQVLGDFFAKLGKENPAQAEEAMETLMEVMQDHKEDTRKVLIETFDAKIKAAPNPQEKDLWEAQKQLFLLSEGAVAPEQAQGTLRDAYIKLKGTSTSNVAPELKEMSKGSLESIENTLRQSMALDMIFTSRNTLEGTFGERKDKNNLEDSLEELQKKSIPELQDAFRNKWSSLNVQDSDAEVYIASVHVLEALRLLLQYQYPIDAAKGPIANPVAHYMELLEQKKGDIVITLPAGVTASANNPLNPKADISFVNTINFKELFIEPTEEFRLFNSYQTGSENMGADSIWNGLKGESAAFGGKKKGLIGLSKDVFAAGDLLNEANLGATEKLTLAKIEDLIEQKHFDEARALAIDIIKTKVPMPSEADIKAKAYDLFKKEGSKIEAQVTLDLEGQGITTANISSFNIKKPDGTNYSDLRTYIQDRTNAALEEKAIIDLYGEKTLPMEVSAAGLSTYEQSALKLLHDLNGKGFMTAENREWGLQIGKMVFEIAIVECATAGLGTFASGALVAGRAGAMGSRTLALSRAFGAQRLGMRAGQSLRNWVTGSRLANVSSAAWVGRRAEYVAQGLASGSNFAWRGLNTGIHAAAFVEGQAMLHGDYVNPASAEGAYQIGMMAGTFWALGKMQQVLRGQTISAQKVAGNAALGTANFVERNILMGRAINALGNPINRLAQKGIPGYLGVTGIELTTEIVGFRYMTDAEEWLGVKAHELTGGAVGISETQRLAMQETEDWRKWGSVAATVLGLRTFRNAKKIIDPYYGAGDMLGLRAEMQSRGLKAEPYTKKYTYEDVPTTTGDIAFGSRSFKAGDVIKVKEGAASVEVKVKEVDGATKKLKVEKTDTTEILVEEAAIETPKTIKVRKVEYVDERGNPIRRNVNSERSALETYLKSLPATERAAIETHVNTLPQMDGKCRVVVNIPCYHEGNIIYETLRQYSKQVGPDGKTALAPEAYEINVIINRETGIAPDTTYQEAMRFKADNPQYRINVIDVVFPKGQGGVGAARKLITDITLQRSLNRKNQSDNLYIETEDADLTHVDPKTVTNIIEKLDSAPHLDAVRGKQDRTPEIMMQNDMFFISRRAFDFAEILLRKGSYRPDQNPNADFTWNRTITGGWNTAYTAEVYAKIGGYNPGMRMGEDMYIGQKISVLRGNNDASGKFVPETTTIGTVATRTDSSPRRFLEAAASDSQVYSAFGDAAKEAAVRGKTTDDLLQMIKAGERISDSNKGLFEREAATVRGFIKERTPNEAEAQKIFDRTMFMLGYKKGDYTGLPDGRVEITNIANVKQALDDYRATPKYLRRYAHHAAATP